MIQTDKPQAFYIIFSVLYDIFYLTLCVNFSVWFSHFYLHTDKAMCNKCNIFSIRMKLELFFLSFSPASLLFLYFFCFLFFLPSCLPVFLSALWKKVLMSSNNLSILQLQLLIAIKLITHFLLLFITIKTFSNPTVTLLTYITFVYRAKKNQGSDN